MDTPELNQRPLRRLLKRTRHKPFFRHTPVLKRTKDGYALGPNRGMLEMAWVLLVFAPIVLLLGVFGIEDIDRWDVPDLLALVNFLTYFLFGGAGLVIPLKFLLANRRMELSRADGTVSFTGGVFPLNWRVTLSGEDFRAVVLVGDSTCAPVLTGHALLALESADDSRGRLLVASALDREGIHGTFEALAAVTGSPPEDRTLETVETPDGVSTIPRTWAPGTALSNGTRRLVGVSRKAAVLGLSRSERLGTLVAVVVGVAALTYAALAGDVLGTVVAIAGSAVLLIGLFWWWADATLGRIVTDADAGTLTFRGRSFKGMTTRTVAMAEILGVQICRRNEETKHRIHRHYQVNVALRGLPGARINVIPKTNATRARHTADTLARLLNVPVLDHT